MTLSENKSVLETAKPPFGGFEIVGGGGLEPTLKTPSASRTLFAKKFLGI